MGFRGWVGRGFRFCSRDRFRLAEVGAGGRVLVGLVGCCNDSVAGWDWVVKGWLGEGLGAAFGGGVRSMTRPIQRQERAAAGTVSGRARLGASDRGGHSRPMGPTAAGLGSADAARLSGTRLGRPGLAWLGSAVPGSTSAWPGLARPRGGSARLSWAGLYPAHPGRAGLGSAQPRPGPAAPELSAAWSGSARLSPTSAPLGSVPLGSARPQPDPARLGSARLGSARLGSARLGSARLGSARLGSARLGSARLGSARLGSARLGSARLGSARLGSARERHPT